MKMIKLMVKTIAAIVFLLILGFGILFFGINSNYCKDRIVQALSKSLNSQKVVIDGDLHWSFYPNFGIKVTHLEVQNPPNFPSAPFVSVQDANVTLKFLPLMSGIIQPYRIDIKYLALNLIINESDQHNWDNLLSRFGVFHAPEELKTHDINLGSQETHNFNWGAWHVADGEVIWQDLASKKALAFNHVHFDTQPIQMDQPFRVSLKFTSPDRLIDPFNANANFKISEKQLELNGLDGHLGQMHFQGEASLNWQSVPEYIAKITMEQVNLAVLGNGRYITGLGNINADGIMHGYTTQQMLKTLQGHFNLSAHDGVFKQIDFSQIVEAAFHFLRTQETLRQPSSEKTTPFSKLMMVATVEQGAAKIQQIHVISPSLSAEGQGTLNLISHVLNLHLNVIPKDLNGMGIIKIKKIKIPVIITGRINDIKLQLDSEKINTAMSQASVQVKLEKIIDKQHDARLRHRLQQNLQQYFKK